MRANCSYNRSLKVRFACLSMYLTPHSSKSTTETRRIDEVDTIPTLNRILEYWNGVKSGYSKNWPLHQGRYHSIVKAWFKCTLQFRSHRKVQPVHAKHSQASR